MAEIARHVGADLNAAEGRRLTGVTHDSRAVVPGDLYAGLPGAKSHGAAFAEVAANAGAVAVLTDPKGAFLARDSGLAVLIVDDPRAALGPVAASIYGHPSKQLRVFGVTGTNGKTTTTYLLEAGLRAAGETTGLVGTIETRIGDLALASERTTPEASDLQSLFAVMVERGVGSVAMEVSSHALALHRVDGTDYDVVAFTNLSQDHLDFHADLDDYFAAKARLFTPAFSTLGLVNSDDEYGRRLLANPEISLLSVSADGDGRAAWWASDVTAANSGWSFVAHGPDGAKHRVETALRGRFNVANTLIAFAMLVTAGVDADRAAAGIASLAGVPGRMEPIEAGQPFAAIVDFAHTPQAVVTLLETLRAQTSGRLIVVLGCGGDRDAAKRPLMGAAAARLADVAVFTSDNPRSEDPEEILRAVVSGARGVSGRRGEVVVEIDRRTAIGIAVRAAGPRDVVVVAGKGHEQGQEIAGTVHHFDDRAVLREQLRTAGWSA